MLVIIKVTTCREERSILGLERQKPWCLREERSPQMLSQRKETGRKETVTVTETHSLIAA